MGKPRVTEFKDRMKLIHLRFLPDGSERELARRISPASESTGTGWVSKGHVPSDKAAFARGLANLDVPDPDGLALWAETGNGDEVALFGAEFVAAYRDAFDRLSNNEAAAAEFESKIRHLAVYASDAALESARLRTPLGDAGEKLIRCALEARDLYDRLRKNQRPEDHRGLPVIAA